MMTKQVVVDKSTRSIPYLGIIFLIFLTLKLAGIGAVATWSWWLVTLPLWGGFALALGLFITLLVVYLLFVTGAGIVIGLSSIVEWSKKRK